MVSPFGWYDDDWEHSYERIHIFPSDNMLRGLPSLVSLQRVLRRECPLAMSYVIQAECIAKIPSKIEPMISLPRSLRQRANKLWVFQIHGIVDALVFCD